MGQISMTFPPSSAATPAAGGWPTSGAYKEISANFYVIQPTDATLVNIRTGAVSFSTWDISGVTLSMLTTNKIFSIMLIPGATDLNIVSGGGAGLNGASSYFMSLSPGVPWAVIFQYNNDPSNPNFVILSQSIF